MPLVLLLRWPMTLIGITKTECLYQIKVPGGGQEMYCVLEIKMHCSCLMRAEN